MAFGVSRRVDPLPVFELGNGPVEWKWLHSVAQINGTARIEGSKERHDSTPSGHVRRGIFFLSAKVGQFQLVREDRHIPGIQNLRKCAHVIEMAMRQQDGGRLA